jgi:hypothetical protein
MYYSLLSQDSYILTFSAEVFKTNKLINSYIVKLAF